MKLRVPHLKQATNIFCGPACIQMILAYYGKPFPNQHKLAKILETNDRVGTTHGNMREWLRNRGFITRSLYFASLQDVEHALAAGTPPVVHFTEPSENDDHYALITEVTPSRVMLNDPWNGKGFSLPRKEFLRRWSDLKGKKHPRWMLVARPR